ncbi:MAG: GNAT family N-acetyltransferase [Brachybacterium sp.]|uniref:GNAT family N-acetyltransferase n=1 Tax=Brachybacterium sp. TaxID=1891286 RepID=UPI00264A50A8|nr:GNAT family N-acetyltransferase [Brachybacterium sp.]MDN6399440.1 GNAT family N-acetyltransferase [Brachybacterium sp.]
MTAHQTRGIRRDSTPRSTAPGESAFVLRTAADDDVPELVDLVQAAYRSEGGWTTEAHLVDGHRTDADEIRAMLADPQVTLLVAELDGDLAGCCYTHREPAEEAGPSRAELGLFAVHPAMQSRGLGGRLLEAQAELLRRAGTEVLVIRVLQGRPELQDWYRRQGFAAVGRAVPFAGNPDWLKVADLGMDVMERPLR